MLTLNKILAPRCWFLLPHVLKTKLSSCKIFCDNTASQLNWAKTGAILVQLKRQLCAPKFWRQSVSVSPYFCKKRRIWQWQKTKRGKKRIKITFSFHEGNWFNPFNPTFILIQKYLKATHYEKKIKYFQQSLRSSFIWKIF